MSGFSIQRVGGRKPGRERFLLRLVLLCGAFIAGCGPNKANTELRKKNQLLEDQVAALRRDVATDQATISGLESRIGTAPTLPESRLEQLFTVHKIQLTRLTGGADLDPSKPGDEGIRVDLEPLDDNGDAIKATGDVTIEAVDMSENPAVAIGQWHFTPRQMKDAWRSLGPLHEFVLQCPWQKVTPQHADLTVKVTFRDELTQRLFTAVQEIKVELSPKTGATTRP